MPRRPATLALRYFWPMLGLTVALVGASACSTGPDGPEDCRSMTAGSARDECWATHAPALFRAAKSRDDAIAVIEQQVEDTQVRDFIWLTITREVDPSSFTYCKKIDERALAERCRVLVSRPHLHRELVGSGQDQSGPGGPPPGAGPGGPPPRRRTTAPTRTTVRVRRPTTGAVSVSWSARPSRAGPKKDTASKKVLPAIGPHRI